MEIQTITVLISSITGYVFGIIQKKYKKDTTGLIPIKNAINGLIIGLLVYATGNNSNLVQSLILGLSGTLASTGIYEAHNSIKPVTKDFKTVYYDSEEYPEEISKEEKIDTKEEK